MGEMIEDEIFLMRLVEIPDMSGVLLSSKFFMQSKISSSVKGCEEKSNFGKLFWLIWLLGEDGRGGGVGWILEAISDAIVEIGRAHV